ncbi:MAG: diiron oxygenase [Kofleriaceae bacterium]
MTSTGAPTVSPPSPTSAMLQKFTSSWERRAQVKRSGVLDVPFQPALPDFLPHLLPPTLASELDALAPAERSRLLSYGWMAFNQKAIDVEHHVLVPACLRLLEQATEAGEQVAVEAVSQAMVDEAYHIYLVRQANQRTLEERGLSAPDFPLSRTVERMREHQARHPAARQRDLTVIGAAIVTEVFIKGYLGELSQAEGVQPLSVLTTRAHLADEAVHSSVFLLLAEQVYGGLPEHERDFFTEVLIRAMSWFPDPELAVWEVAIRAAAVEGGERLIQRCWQCPPPEVDYAELSAFLRRVGVGDVERHLARLHAAEVNLPS